MTMVTKHISAAHFKAQCLSLMDQVEAQRGEVIITKRGKPVAKLVPIDNTPRSIFGCMAGTAEILGDLIGPTTLGDDWDANR
jgi:prevent-host-death family protein